MTDVDPTSQHVNSDGLIEEDHEASSLEGHLLTARRLEKVRQLKQSGVEPYPVGFRRSDLAAELHERFGSLEAGAATDERVTVAGRVLLHRSFGKLVFATIQDGSGRIQLMAQEDTLGDDLARFEELDVGDMIGADGEIVTTRKGELSVRVESFQLLAKGLRPLPEKWHGLSDTEIRSRRRYLDLIVNPASRDVAIARSRIISELRRQFESRGYIEVETPVLLSQAGGALARPFRTHHNALDIDMYLRIATELPLKMLIVGGIERVFEIGRIFRNEGVDGTHNPEFTMLESYEAYADYHDIMSMVEEMFSHLAGLVHGSVSFEYQGREIDLSAPFRRARMVDLVAEAVGEPVWPPPHDLVEIARRHDVHLKNSTCVRRLFFLSFILLFPSYSFFSF
jgi:lysyl-tRNA synthetase class 2